MENQRWLDCRRSTIPYIEGDREKATTASTMRASDKEQVPVGGHHKAPYSAQLMVEIGAAVVSAFTVGKLLSN